MTKIGIINYDVGNLTSLINSFLKLGCKVEIVNNPREIKNYDKLILPGVGNFDYAIKQFNSFNYKNDIEEFINKKKHILGICLGMQLMCNSSQESKNKGLGRINAEVLNFKNKADENLILPHIGWNSVKLNKKIEIFNNIPEDSDFYFTHSFAVFANNHNLDISTTYYGIDFVSVFKKENIFGVQFHPEKSDKFGLKLLKNFIEL